MRAFALQGEFRLFRDGGALPLAHGTRHCHFGRFQRRRRDRRSAGEHTGACCGAERNGGVPLHGDPIALRGSAARPRTIAFPPRPVGVALRGRAASETAAPTLPLVIFENANRFSDEHIKEIFKAIGDRRLGAAVLLARSEFLARLERP
jgi:hypothetical protein